MNKLLILYFMILIPDGFSMCSHCMKVDNSRTYNDPDSIEDIVGATAYNLVKEAERENIQLLDSECDELEVIKTNSFYKFSTNSNSSYIIFKETKIDNVIHETSICQKVKTKKSTTIECVSRSKRSVENMIENEKYNFLIEYTKIKVEGGGLIDAIVKCPRS